MNNYTPDLKGRYIVMISDYISDWYNKDDIQEEKEFLTKIHNDLKELGLKMFFVETTNLVDLEKKLKKFDKDKIVIFNWFEEVDEKRNSGHLVTEFLEKNGYVYTGAGTEALLLTQSKIKTIKALEKNRVNIPKHYEMDEKPDNIEFPVIVKYKFDHGSYNLTTDSVLENTQELEEAKKKFDKDYYMEQYIPGRELALTVIGNEDPEVLPIMEYVFPEGLIEHDIQDHESKWERHSTKCTSIEEIHPTDIPEKVVENIKDAAVKTYLSVNQTGFARIEMRLNGDKPYVIDFNVNPDFRPGSSILAAMHGNYNEGALMARMCEYALDRIMNS